MTTPNLPDWVTDVPSTDAVHLPPNPKPALRPVSAQQLVQIGAEFIEQFLKRVVSAVVGIFFPNQKAFEQLAQWGSDLINDAGKVIGNIGGVIMDGVSTVGGFLLGLWNGLTNNPGNTGAKTAAEVSAASGSLRALAGTAQSSATAANTAAGAAQTAADGAATAAGAAQNTADNAEAQAVANAAELAKLVAAQNGSETSGAYAFDNFDYVTTSGLSADWAVAGSGGGYLRVDGSKLLWVDSGGAAGSQILRFLKAKTLTSYQLVTMVLDSPKIESPLLGGAEAFNYLVGRLNAAYTSYVYVKIGHNAVSVWKVIDGVGEYPIGSAASYTPKVGDTIQFQLGNPDTSDLRQFRVKVNNTPILTVTDGTGGPYGPAVSVEDAVNNTWSGTAFAAAPRLGGGQSTPGAVSIFSVCDNKPAPMLGSGLRAYRTNTGTGAVSSGANIFPLGWFNNVDRTPDLTYDSLTGRVTVSVEGWYQCILQQHGDSAVSFGTALRNRAVLWRNGTGGVRQVAQEGWNRPVNDSVGFRGISGTFLIYLKAGDWVEPGYWSDGALSGVLSANTGGTLTWFSVALVNRSYN